MCGSVADGLGGETVDQFPVNAIRAAGHAEAAPLAFAKPPLAWTFVFPIDAKVTHLVAPRSIGLARILIDTKQFVIVRLRVRAVIFVLAAKEDVGLHPVDRHQVERRFDPMDAVVTLSITHPRPALI